MVRHAHKKADVFDVEGFELFLGGFSISGGLCCFLLLVFWSGLSDGLSVPRLEAAASSKNHSVRRNSKFWGVPWGFCGGSCGRVASIFWYKVSERGL